MEETKNMAAFILSRQTYREYDVLVRAYTLERGKLSLVVRGAKKLKSKLAGHIEPLTKAEIMVVKGRGLDYLGSAVTRNSYSGIRADLNKLYYAGRALNISDRLLKENLADQAVFIFLEETLDVLDRAGKKLIRGGKLDPTATSLNQEWPKEKGQLWLAFFIFRLISILGHQPEIKKCLLCSQIASPGKNYFDLIGGGLICAHCRPQFLASHQGQADNLLAVSDDCLKVLKLINKIELEKILRIQANKRLTDELLNFSLTLLKFIN